jgi:hypothetical protein
MLTDKFSPPRALVDEPSKLTPDALAVCAEHDTVAILLAGRSDSGSPTEIAPSCRRARRAAGQQRA